ncbi:hypothetical protein TNCV_1810581 [Trichonephila clavipes]|nr:hypothetical protein TNCV_1810581 [Trichonephila clavipes]
MKIHLGEVLKTIPVKSVEAERAFSAAGLFVTKLETRLLSGGGVGCLKVKRMKERLMVWASFRSRLRLNTSRII